ncbi:uncharacterized protein LOC106130420 [Amyelois transitella]|uniref:uncharacterized protein LOC106130420 n=1 Tax=Amyelois transitella TaxID=680683 RepID=UPI00067AE1B5|nr:uncharacterized protein LOC106130420 [Amyelois transitella]
MLIQSIFMELRSRLRSCNVFITTGVDFSKNCNLKISIQSNCIVLNYYDDGKLKRRDSLSSIESLSDCSEDDSDVMCVIPIEEFCHIIPNSMSCLKFEKNTISFRILTEPRTGGNFYKEILNSDTNESSNKKSELIINVKVDDEIKIVCSNCSNTISKNLVKFERILELPTTNLDMSEWFCHGHGHDHDTKFEPTLKSNKDDFLYRLTFFVINNSVLSEKTNKFNAKRDIYHCNRCLAWLGLKEKGNVKLFNSEVKMTKDDFEKSVFSHKNTLGDIQTDDFIFTIEKLTQEFNLGFQYVVMCKIILECTVATNKKQYLLIWVMDKELQVLKNSGEHIDSEKIKLQSSFLTKILYKIEFSLNDEVESWLADPAVVSTDVSKGMFCRGVEHLQKMSLKVPEMFRNTNGYCVSYLKV